MKSKVHLMTHVKKEQRKTHMHISLFILVISSLSLAITNLIDLEYEDKVTIKRGCLLFIYGLIFFSTLYHVLNNLFARTTSGQKIIKNYHLSIGDVFDINNKIVSAVQAVFCCFTGLTSCWYSCRRDILKTSHFISEAYAWFGAAYFFYDIWSMYRVHSAKNNDYRLTFYLQKNWIIIGHHIFIGAFGFLTITYLRGDLGDCFFGFVYLMEASTPFVSIRGILSKFGKKETKFYVINGLIMLTTFFIFRVAMFPFVLYFYSKTIQMDYLSAIKSLPNGCKLSILIILMPQVYWFLLMVKGASQVLITKNNNKKVTNHNKKNKRNFRN